MTSQPAERFDLGGRIPAEHPREPAVVVLADDDDVGLGLTGNVEDRPGDVPVGPLERALTAGARQHRAGVGERLGDPRRLGRQRRDLRALGQDPACARLDHVDGVFDDRQDDDRIRGRGLDDGALEGAHRQRRVVVSDDDGPGHAPRITHPARGCAARTSGSDVTPGVRAFPPASAAGNVWTLARFDRPTPTRRPAAGAGAPSTGGARTPGRAAAGVRDDSTRRARGDTNRAPARGRGDRRRTGDLRDHGRSRPGHDLPGALPARGTRAAQLQDRRRGGRRLDPPRADRPRPRVDRRHRRVARRGGLRPPGRAHRVRGRRLHRRGDLS